MLRKTKFAIKTVLIFLLIQCTNSTEVTHPTADNFPQTAGLQTLDMNATPQFTAKEFEHHLFANKSQHKLNVPSELEFTVVVDIAISKGADDIYVLADNRNEALVFDGEGKFKYSIGQAGRGPGDLLSPVSIQVTDEGHLAILERSKVEIVSFQDDSFNVYKTILHGLDTVYDMCISKDELFISGFKISEAANPDQEFPIEVSKPIHRYSISEGKKIDEFGINYKTNNRWPVFDGQLSAKKISCNDNSNFVAAMNRMFPFFYLYKMNGELKKTTSIKNFNSQNVYESLGDTNLPQLRFGSNIQGFNYTHNLILDNDGKYAYLQINKRLVLPDFDLGRLNQLLNSMEPESHIFKVNITSGEATLLTNNSPQVLFFNQTYHVISDVGVTMLDEFKKERAVLTFIKPKNND